VSITAGSLSWIEQRAHTPGEIRDRLKTRIGNEDQLLVIDISGDAEIGIAAIFKKTCTRGKNLIERQNSLLQRDGAAEKSYIQVSALTRTCRCKG
jgi:hypothetical protein